MKANDNSDWLGCTHTPTTQCKGNLISHLLQNSEQFLFSRKQFVIFYYFSFNRGLMKDVLSIISQIICLCHYVFEKASETNIWCRYVFSITKNCAPQSSPSRLRNQMNEWKRVHGVVYVMWKFSFKTTIYSGNMDKSDLTEQEKVKELLKEIQLDQFYRQIHGKLHITRLSHFDHVTEEDLDDLGMAKPEQRRLFEALKKAKKKSLFSSFRRKVRLLI